MSEKKETEKYVKLSNLFASPLVGEGRAPMSVEAWLKGAVTLQELFALQPGGNIEWTDGPFKDGTYERCRMNLNQAGDIAVDYWNPDTQEWVTLEGDWWGSEGARCDKHVLEQIIALTVRSERAKVEEVLQLARQLATAVDEPGSLDSIVERHGSATAYVEKIAAYLREKENP